MAGYGELASRIERREIIILDGAVGTQLQTMGVPMNNHAWAALALHSHPYTVRRMHENYISADVDIITTNTYASARHNLEPLGLSELTGELNLRAVMLAEDARRAKAKDRPVYIAGSVSNFGLIAGIEKQSEELFYRAFGHRTETSVRQAKMNLREQAQILADAGVDFLIAEATGSSEQRHWVIEACKATGLPVWSGFKTRLEEGDNASLVGYSSSDHFTDQLDELLALEGEVAAIFHSSLSATETSLQELANHWKGPVAIYPEAERHDYVAAHKNLEDDSAAVTPEAFVAFAQRCVQQGAQIIGGCCGIEVEHIRPLRAALPTHLTN